MPLDPPLDLVPPLLEGLRVTLRLTLVGGLIALAFSALAGAAILSRLRPIRFLGRVYVEVFRGTSVLVQLFWLYFALPRLGVELSAFQAGVVALGLNGGAYGAEIFRGAVNGVPPGQREAAAALGFGKAQTFVRIIVPQAFRAMIPPAGNLLIELLKNSALASMITLADLTFQAQVLRASTMRTAEVFGLVLLVYFGLSQLISYGMRRLEAAVSLEGA